MSAALVRDRRATQTFVDDLESFFYVIVWLALMYSPNSMSPPALTSFVKSVLDPAQYQGTGGNCKANFLIGRADLLGLSFTRRPLLQPLLKDFATLFAVRYETKPSNDEYDVLAELEQTSARSASFLPAWKHRERLQVLKSQAHTHVAQLLTTAVAQQQMWPAISSGDSGEQEENEDRLGSVGQAVEKVAVGVIRWVGGLIAHPKDFLNRVILSQAFFS
jgi:hypothetical protein